jgi:hypothetical protein
MALDQLFGALRGYQQISLTLWSIYIGVISGILGYAIAGQRPLKPAVRCLLIVMFVLHALGNASFLERNQQMLHALSAEIAERAPTDVVSEELRLALKKLPSRQSESILPLHVGVDFVVVALIWIAPILAARGRAAIGGAEGEDTQPRMRPPVVKAR